MRFIDAVHEVALKVRKHRKLLVPHYHGMAMDCEFSWGYCDDFMSIFVSTKLKRGTRQRIEDICKAFGAKRVSFIGRMDEDYEHPAFWAIEFPINKVVSD